MPSCPTQQVLIISPFQTLLCSLQPTSSEFFPEIMCFLSFFPAQAPTLVSLSAPCLFSSQSVSMFNSVRAADSLCFHPCAWYVTSTKSETYQEETGRGGGRWSLVPDQTVPFEQEAPLHGGTHCHSLSPTFQCHLSSLPQQGCSRSTL